MPPVPTLVLDDGTAIGEVPAILRYLDEACPSTPLLGVSPKDKALSLPIPDAHAASLRWYAAVAARPSMAA